MSPANRFCSMFAFALMAGIPGCFALFPLDDYQGGSIVVDAGAPEGGPKSDDAAADAKSDAQSGNSRLIFVTTPTFPGSMAGASSSGGGSAAGDAICSDLAAAAGRSGKFKVLLSDATTAAKGRVTEDASAPRPVVDTGGRVLAPSLQALFQGTLAFDVSRTESGAVVEAGEGQCGNNATAIVWTGAGETGGRKDASPCNNWKSNASTMEATVGLPQTTDQWLDGSCTVACDKQAHLYCIEE